MPLGQRPWKNCTISQNCGHFNDPEHVTMICWSGYPVGVCIVQTAVSSLWLLDFLNPGSWFKPTLGSKHAAWRKWALTAEMRINSPGFIDWFQQPQANFGIRSLKPVTMYFLSREQRWQKHYIQTSRFGALGSAFYLTIVSPTVVCSTALYIRCEALIFQAWMWLCGELAN